MVRKEVKFNKSMNIDKRNEDFAYLSLNVSDNGTKGLYPAKDFKEITDGNELETGDEILDILGSDNDTYGRSPFAIVRRGSKLIFLDKNLDESYHSDFTSEDVTAIVNGNDGVYFVDENTDKVYRPNYQNDNVVQIGTFPSQPNVVIGLFDGLHYWWIGGKIWRQLSDKNPELVMAETGFNDIKFAVPYKDYIVIFTQGNNDYGTYNQNLIVYIYDKKNSTLFSKRIELKDTVVLGAGVLGGDRLIMITGTGDSRNAKELIGKISVSAFNGERFVELNSIKAGRTTIRPAPSHLAGVTCKYNSERIVFAVDNNDISTNSEIFSNYIYEVYYNGEIRALTLPKPQTSSINYASGVSLGKNYVKYWTFGSGNIKSKVYIQEDDDRSYGYYLPYTETEYITNFYCNPYNRHKLTGMSFTFEKMFNNNQASYAPDVSGYTLSAIGNIGTQVEIGFALATDTLTPQNELRYKLYRSDISNISDVAQIELNGTEVSDWVTFETLGQGLITATDLTPEATYYFNVIVQDNSGKKVSYPVITVIMNEVSEITSWYNPTQNGALDYGGGAQPKFTSPTNAYSQNSSYATGDNNAISIYYGFGASIPVGKTISRIETRFVGHTLPHNSFGGGTQISFKIYKNATTTTPYASLVMGVVYLSATNENDLTFVSNNSNWSSANISQAELPNIGLSIENQASASPVPVRTLLNNIKIRVIYK